MKIMLLILSFILSAMFLNGQTISEDSKGFVLKVQLSNNSFAENSLRLVYKVDSEYLRDSNYIEKNGFFIFQGKVEFPTPAILQVYNKELGIQLSADKVIMNPVLPLILTNEIISVTGDAKNIHIANVTGGIWNNEWKSIKQIRNQETHREWLKYKLELSESDNRIDIEEVSMELKSLPPALASISIIIIAIGAFLNWFSPSIIGIDRMPTTLQPIFIESSQ